jgi:hypothetical protein
MASHNEHGLNAVKLDKKALLDTIKSNREQHAKDYAEAVKVYHERLRDACQEKLAAINNREEDKVVPSGLSLIEPRQFLSDYDRAIRMLEMSVDERITLTQGEFNQYVMDEWHWRGQFETTKAYASSAPGAGR